MCSVKALKLIPLAFVLSLASSSHADTVITAAPQLAAPLYTLGGTARATAMGSAFAGVADDASSLYYNPAGLGWIDGFELGLHHNSWLVGSNRESLLLGSPITSGGALAASFSYMDWGSFDVRDNNGNLTGSYTDRDLEASLGWGERLSGSGPTGLSLGLSLRGLKQRIYQDGALGISGDLGALWAPTRLLRLGLSYTHLGSSLASSNQASNINVAASLYRYALSKEADFSLAAATALEPSGISRIQLGGEGWLYDTLALRAGYVVSLADNQLGGLSGLTAGAGFKRGDFELDYSFLPYGDLGNAQWISLVYKPVKPVPTPMPPPPPLPTPSPAQERDRQQEQDLKDAGMETARMGDNSLQVTMASDALKFKTMSDELSDKDLEILAKLAGILKKNPDNRIDIEGYTDNKGEKDYNDKLSLKRAQSVKEALQDAGLPEDCVRSVKGLGFSNPVASNKNETGRAKNRRVVLHIHLAE
jgi:outer membrane protein OmpA-like peptidoglycan-associated protein